MVGRKKAPNFTRRNKKWIYSIALWRVWGRMGHPGSLRPCRQIRLMKSRDLKLYSVAGEQFNHGKGWEKEKMPKRAERKPRALWVPFFEIKQKVLLRSELGGEEVILICRNPRFPLEKGYPIP